MLRIRVCAEIDADRQHVRLVRCCPKNTLGDDAIEDVLCGGDQVGNVSRLVLDDSNNPFWNEPQEAKLEPRGRVRYVIPRGLPLWFDEHEETLGKLSVSRAKGGTVFNLTEEQWNAVVMLAGGWPSSSTKITLGSIGQPYSNVGQLPLSASRDAFEVDPDKIGRGNQAHATTQDALADYLRGKGIEPLQPKPGDPEFDLAWEAEKIVFVAEVKSVTSANEEKQLRLGLGQVLRYRHLLGRGERRVVAALVAEREPKDPSWVGLCRELGVVLVWPGAFERVMDRP